MPKHHLHLLWNRCVEASCVFRLSKWVHGSSFLFPRYVDSAIAGPGGAKNLPGANVLRLIRIRLTTSSLAKIMPDSQDDSLLARVADSSSTNAVSFSSARTTKRSDDAVIRVYDAAGNVMEMHEHKGDFKEW
jgi:hypothetical protein